VNIDIEAVRALTVEVARLNDRLQKIRGDQFSMEQAFQAGVVIGENRAASAKRQPVRKTGASSRPARAGLRLITGEAAER
jgi:hypothetical protein